MKKKILNKAINMIKKNKKLDSNQEEIILYGLESIYLTLSKIIIVLLLAIILEILKEVLILLLCYNVFRLVGFGLHATKSSYCLISSIVMFIGGAFICKYLYIPNTIQIILAIFSMIIFYFYAPADTKKRPIINMKKRKIYKTLTVLFSLLFTIAIITLKDNPITIYMMLGMILESIMIHPLTYKIFNLPYDNYKEYLKKYPESIKV